MWYFRVDFRWTCLCTRMHSWDNQGKPPTTLQQIAKTDVPAPPSLTDLRTVDVLKVPALRDIERSRMSFPARQPTPRPVDSLVPDDDATSRMSSLPERPSNVDVGGPWRTVDAIRRMRRRHSRGERTRRRERSLARLSRTSGAQSQSPFDKPAAYVDASGSRLKRYSASPPSKFFQLPFVDEPRTADDEDDDVGSLFRVRSSRPEASPTSWKSFATDEEEQIEKVVGSRTSTPGKLRSLLMESGTKTADSVFAAETQQPLVAQETTEIAGTPTAKRLSYVVQPATHDDDMEDTELADVVPLSIATPAAARRSSLESRLSEPVVTHASVETVIDPEPGSRFVTALSHPYREKAVELQRIRDSFSSQSVASTADHPSPPSPTTSNAALHHLRQKGDAAIDDVPAQPSLSKQAPRSSLLAVTDIPQKPSVTKHAPRSSVLAVTDVPQKPSVTKQAPRSSLLDVSDVPQKPSVTKASKPIAPSLDDITMQRMRILGRPPDDEYRPMLQTPFADSEWETVYEEDMAQSTKPYPFYRTPVMRSALRSPSPQTTTRPRRSWARGPPGGWTQQSQRRYSVPRVSPPKFVRRHVRHSSCC